MRCLMKTGRKSIEKPQMIQTCYLREYWFPTSVLSILGMLPIGYAHLQLMGESSHTALLNYCLTFFVPKNIHWSLPECVLTKGILEMNMKWEAFAEIGCWQGRSSPVRVADKRNISEHTYFCCTCYQPPHHFPPSPIQRWQRHPHHLLKEHKQNKI